MKHHKLKHETRYKAALARITPAREADIRARALKELGLVAYPTMHVDRAPVDKLVAHKLGRRVPKRSTPELS